MSFDYLPIPKGAQPPMLKFDNDTEFHQALSDNAYEIHVRMLYAIDYAYNTDFEGEITIAFLNDEDTIVGCPQDVWVDNLEMSLEYFIDIEDYEKCQEVQQLINKIK